MGGGGRTVEMRSNRCRVSKAGRPIVTGAQLACRAIDACHQMTRATSASASPIRIMTSVIKRLEETVSAWQPVVFGIERHQYLGGAPDDQAARH